MDLLHRKLLSGSICEPIYCEDSNDSGICPQLCLGVCPNICLHPSHHHHKPKTFLVITIVFLVTTFFLVCSYAMYCKFYLSSRRRSQPQPQPQPQTDETYDEFLDEDHGPVVDHHIWYINTIGLQPSIINAITVCKYKSGDGLVEGTECSVCLNEFQEDETLRLLPKCSHAFHVPCIDTWLRSHTNCPLCRAPIVKNTARASSSEANVDNSGVGEETRLNISEDNEGAEREMDSGVHELRIEAQEESELTVENERKRVEDSNEGEGSIQPMRRSVSLDSLSALKISQALANVIPMESNGNSETQLVKSNESNTGIVSKGVGNHRLLRLMASSSIGRSLQNRPIPLERSFSCNEKFLLSRYSRRQGLSFRM